VGGGGNSQDATTPSATQTPLLSQEGNSETCPNPKYIFYSLGNFIFDQEWSRETKEGLTLKMTISKPNCHPELVSGSILGDGSDSGSGTKITCADDLQGQKIPATLTQIELLPVIIENYSTPRPATEEETKKILQKIGEVKTILY
jgi:hypothetical protein